MADKEATLLLRIKELGSEALSHVVVTLGEVKEMAMKVFEAMMKPIEAFKEAELAANRLTQAMINSGVFSSDLRKEYVELAESLSEVTTYSKDQIVSAMAVMQANARGITITEELTKATLDYASATGNDLNSAAEKVGKTLDGKMDALRRDGIAIDMTKNSSERLIQVTDQLNKKFEDQATVAASGLGVMKQISNQFQENQVVIGEELAPTLIVLLKTFQDVWFSVDNGASKAQMLGDVFAWLVKGALYVKAGFDELGAAIGIGLAAAVEATKAAVSLEFSKAAQIISDADQALADDQEKRAQVLSDRILAIDSRKYAQKNINRAHDEEDERTSENNKTQIQVEKNADALQRAMEFDDFVRAQRDMSTTEMLSAQVSYLDKKIVNETNAQTKIDLLNKKHNLSMELTSTLHAAKEKEIEDAKHAAMISSANQFLGNIASLQTAHNQGLVLIGKAAAMAQIAINTAEAAMSSFKWGSALGGPALGASFAGLAIVAGAVQEARVAGIELADGGIVQARPGGVLATIGEGGRDEAVIPLENGRIPGSGDGGSHITIVVNGGLLGDAASAHEFALAVDKELFRLRKSNESLAFDSGVV